MTSTLGYGILGLLARRPLTGYEIAQRLRTPVGYFWSAGHSQIYPELARLGDDRLVKHIVVPGRGPRENKRYSLTARGRSALRTWVVSEPPVAPAKSELLMRVYSIWLASPTAARRMLVSERERHEAALSTYEGIADANSEAVFGAPEFGDLATVRAGLGYEQHTIEWLDWLLDRLPG